MTLGTKKSLPGKYKIIHGKPSKNPRLETLSLKQAEELGIVLNALIISPLPIRVTNTDNTNENTQESIE
jgi:hypothetical protein